ncbi:hypothetical protein GTA08_BOTSDO06529 [Botryosphaeria dothidea]|uniref:Uncharacterized protein n=1 Tax=Botryosphaeria dothidea TaxID=55169 RepID=A0A8H4N7Y5_9PEZI|nr:hypothetical protein GTA08_BOTSDO06529 [Botryosphaeria dothidea]
MEPTTYITVVAEVINEGLPRASWLNFGNHTTLPLPQRLTLTLTLTHTLILTQTLLGLLLSLTILAAAPPSATSASPPPAASPRPSRSPAKFLLNIALDLLLLSLFRVRAPSANPGLATQAGVRLACDLSAAFAGLAYFLLMTARRRGVRNALYLWLVSGIVAMGNAYATAWGALEATSLAFVGHAWGAWRARGENATRRDMLELMGPVLQSCSIALLFEVPLCVFLARWGARRFAYYLSGTEDVSRITEKMWRTID